MHATDLSSLAKQPLLEPWPFLENPARFVWNNSIRFFTSLVFTIVFFLGNDDSLTCNPELWGPALCIYVLQWQGDPVFPQALDSFSIASCDSQGYGGSTDFWPSFSWSIYFVIIKPILVLLRTELWVRCSVLSKPSEGERIETTRQSIENILVN